MIKKKLYVIGNWKMNVYGASVASLASGLAGSSVPSDMIEVIVCPPFVYLDRVRTLLERSSIRLGSQDVFWEAEGAFTGEISPPMLREYGVLYAIIGHSDRRRYLRENDEMVRRKVAASLSHGITPILCIGESFEQRRDGKKNPVITLQLKRALEKIALPTNAILIIAYEPIWAIGSGQACDPDEAREASYVIKNALYEQFDQSVVDNRMPIIYGGSVQASNVHEFVDGSSFVGVLVGGASTNTEQFANIIQEVARIYQP